MGGFGGGFRGNPAFFRRGFVGDGFGFGFGGFPVFYSGFSAPIFDGYYGGYGGYGGYPPVEYVSPPASYAPPPPVVVNEYYAPPAPARPQIRDYSAGGYGTQPGPLPQPQAAAKRPEYWLIAFPNGTVTLAVAYWTEGDMLHYVTRNKEQRRIPLSSIDRDLTEQLNRERGLEFH